MIRRIARNPHRTASALLAWVAIVVGIAATASSDRIWPALVGVLVFALLSTVAHLLEGDS